MNPNVRELFPESVRTDEAFPYIGLATVAGPLLEKGTCLVRLVSQEGGVERNLTARLFFTPDEPVRVGDEVLVLATSPDAVFIAGKAPSDDRPARSVRQIETKSGASARLASSGEQGQEEELRVFSGKGQLIFRYLPESGKSIVSAPEGDMEFLCPDGDISFVSKKEIRMRGGGKVSLQSDRSVSLGVGDGENARIALTRDQIDLSGNRLRASGQEADVALLETRFRGNRLLAKIDQGKIVARRLETVADAVVQKAKNMVRHVENLNQTTAGRMKTLVRDLYHLKGRWTVVKAEKKVKINGEKIHLG